VWSRPRPSKRCGSCFNPDDARRKFHRAPLSSTVLVSIHQPHYLPWLRYPEIIARSDLFIVLDDVDFNRNGWQNRNKIKTARQSHPDSAGPPEAQNPDLRRRDQRALGPQALDDADPELRLGTPFRRPQRIARRALRARLEEAVRAGLRDAQVAPPGARHPNAVRAFVDHPHHRDSHRAPGRAGASGRRHRLPDRQHAFSAYLDPKEFQKAGLELWIFDWSAPTYKQIHPGQGFIPSWPPLDLLFCEGGQRGREILASGSQVKRYEP